jgi:hypothetical protein
VFGIFGMQIKQSEGQTSCLSEPISTDAFPLDLAGGVGCCARKKGEFDAHD